MTTFAQLNAARSDAIAIGLLRRDGKIAHALLCPPTHSEVRPSDLVVVVAEDAERALTLSSATPVPVAVRAELEAETENASASTKKFGATSDEMPRRRVLFLGWSHKAPAILQELFAHHPEYVEVTVLSGTEISHREEGCRGYQIIDSGEIKHLRGDYAAIDDVKMVEPEKFDSILILSSDRAGSDVEADARSVMGWLNLEDVFEPLGLWPKVVVEVLDPHNTELFDPERVAVFTTPLLVSRALTQIVLRRDMASVLKTLLSAEGPDLSLWPMEMMTEPGEGMSFDDLQRRVGEQGAIAIGFYRRGAKDIGCDGLWLNPGASARWTVEAGDAVVVLQPSD